MPSLIGPFLIIGDCVYFIKYMSKRELHICNFAVAHRVDLTYKCKTMFLKKKKKSGKKEKQNNLTLYLYWRLGLPYNGVLRVLRGSLPIHV